MATKPQTQVRDRYEPDQIKDYYEAGLWQSKSFYELITERAENHGDRRFCFDSTTSLTYAEFHDQALRLAVGLKRQGIERGDRVAVQLPNWTEFPVIAAALSRIGAIIVPIMPIYRDDEVGYTLRHSGAVAAFTCEEMKGFNHLRMFQELRADAPDVRFLVAVRPSEAVDNGTFAFQDLLVEGSHEELETEAGDDSSPDDGFLIVYTSGTTSRPKGCYHTFNTLHASARAMADGLAYTSDDVQFGPSPITHSTGLVTSVLLPMLVGAQTHFMEAWDPEEGLRRIEEHKCTAAVTATPFIQMLMGAYDPERHDPSSLRLWVCAGSPIPGSVIEQAAEMLPGCRTLSLYGRSENMTTTMCKVDDPSQRSVTSDGSAMAGAEVKVVDSEGNEVARGEEGDIAFRGPSHMLEYFNDPQQTAALFTADGFSRSGDLGRMDADGFVRVTGRLKDIVIRGGMNISAREIEEHLLSHPAIENAAVVGMPDERLGEKVCAYVILKPGAEPLSVEQTAEFLRSHGVATQKLPERIEITEGFPMTATGKIQKHLLRADVAEKLKG
ncbi:cyclohexanecarboxylate-CoA ligase [Nocardioides seonyuensis]|uniref:Cyclohexanecarboxylate-CoA ligase n=1 Tax=Nocardioides seonyuensis TaxID=2518371 RepID=A0A4P7IF96_9ACTN|nr:AMP-binding protein [Nocardioides seonyuensis]QBX55906.1 cyclohexanecarboxylate-CoA ligase [Nocardioides seonyuensis]